MLRPEDCALAVIDIQENSSRRSLKKSAWCVTHSCCSAGQHSVAAGDRKHAVLKGTGQRRLKRSVRFFLKPSPWTSWSSGCFGNGEYCFNGREPGEPQYAAALRHGIAHLRDADRAWSLNQGLNVHIAADAVKLPH